MNKTEQFQVEFNYNNMCLCDSLSLAKCENQFLKLSKSEKR